MKLRSASLDDLHQEALYACDERGTRLARACRWAAQRAYRAHSELLLAVLRMEAVTRRVAG